jgi:CDP-diacylglycerol---glycerol-3-phosphate 3-phosphatidyltransferase
MRALSELRSLPNLISISRLALAAAFVATERTDVRIVLVMLALATDYLDGWLARHVGPMTRVGAMLDPFADRVFVLVGVSVFLFEGTITTLEYFIMISRDLMTAIGFLVARAIPSLRAIAFQARFPGKLVTVLQLASFIGILIRPEDAQPMILVVAIVSLWAIVDYTWMLHKGRNRSGTRAADNL